MEPERPDTNFGYSHHPELCRWSSESCGKHPWPFGLFKKGFIIGYAVFFVLVIVALIPYDFPFWMKFMIREKMLKLLKMLKLRKNLKIRKPEQVTDLHTWDNLPEGSSEIRRLEKMVTRMPYEELRYATDNFSEKNIIGLGKMGIMFKATLPTGNFFAIKKLHYSQLYDEKFIAELKIHGIISHMNILSLVGFCIKSAERFLVYKYMQNGRLFDWINRINHPVIDWPSRVKIATGVARCLAWMHQGSCIRIFHLNISSKCILLDQYFEPKVSNFEEAIIILPGKISSQNTEFWETAFVKEDVYSFGIVLLELITWKDSSNSYEDSQKEWITRLMDRNSSCFRDLIDECVSGKGFDDEIFQFLEIAFSCVHSDPDQRPTMLQVYENIKNVGEKHSIVYDPELLINCEIPIANEKSVEIELVE